jgi:hypothetical protein
VTFWEFEKMRWLEFVYFGLPMLGVLGIIAVVVWWRSRK